MTSIVLGRDDGLRLQSGPGRDLVFKVTGNETGDAFEYSILDVAPHVPEWVAFWIRSFTAARDRAATR